MSQPNKPGKPQTPKLPPRDIGKGIFYDALELPEFVTKANKIEFYYRWSNEKKWPMLRKLGYEQVKDPDTKKTMKIGTKDSEESLLLVRQPRQYRAEDLVMKKNRANELQASQEVKVPAGMEGYTPIDRQAD